MLISYFLRVGVTFAFSTIWELYPSKFGISEQQSQTVRNNPCIHTHKQNIFLEEPQNILVSTDAYYPFHMIFTGDYSQDINTGIHTTAIQAKPIYQLHSY